MHFEKSLMDKSMQVTVLSEDQLNKEREIHELKEKLSQHQKEQYL